MGSIWLQGAAIAATVVCLMTPAFRARAFVPADTLQITENSSSSLSVLWNGGIITPNLIGGGDHWQFTLPVGVHLGFGEGSFGSPSGAVIREPGPSDPGPYNNVFTSTTIANPFVNLVDVQSDSKTTSGFAVLLTDSVAGNVGTDASGIPITLTFHDVGDGDHGGSVADTGSTAALLACAFGLLGGLRRKMAV